MKKFSMKTKLKIRINDFYFLYKSWLWFGLFILLSLLTLGVLNNFFSLHFNLFLKESLYPFTTGLSTIVIALIAYQNYQMQLPKIEGKVILLHKNFPVAQNHFPNLKSETDFFLAFLVDNTGQRIVNIRCLKSDQEEILYLVIDKNTLNKNNTEKDVHQNSFGYVLEAGKCYKEMIPLTSHYLEIFKRSKRLYVVDISNRKYLLPTEDLIRGQAHIKDIENKKK